MNAYPLVGVIFINLFFYITVLWLYSYSRSCRETKLKNWIVKSIKESRYIIGATTVQLAGVKCIDVLKDNLLKCIM